MQSMVRPLLAVQTWGIGLILRGSLPAGAMAQVEKPSVASQSKPNIPKTKTNDPIGCESRSLVPYSVPDSSSSR